RSAGHAAATAHVPTHAPHAATYAATATGAPKDPGTARERGWQYQRLPDHLRPVVTGRGNN
ncbi:MAG: putative immunity protein, partial [Rubrobacteraceae bacterium]